MVARSVKVWLLSGILSIATGGTAFADDRCPVRGAEIATDRPDVTNSSLVVPKGSLQNENGIDVSRHDGAQVINGTNSRLRLGVAHCVEVLVDLPSYSAALAGSAEQGFSNVSPAVKWQLPALADRFDLSATFGVGLPTGARRIAGDGAQPYVQFPWSYELLDGWGVSGMLTNFFTPADADDKTTTQATFVVEKQITAHADLFVEYVGDFPSRSGSAQLINSGGAWRIAPNRQIDFHVGVGINHNAPSYVIGIGYSFRLDGLF